MGLPQASSSNFAEEVPTSLSTFVQTPSRLCDLSSCDPISMYHGHLSNQTSGDLTITSSREPDALSLHKDSVMNAHRLKTNSTEESCMFRGNTGRHLRTPVSRIVGFESKVSELSASVLKDNQCDDVRTLNVVSSDTATGMNASLAKKRLLSPMNGKLLPDKFDEDLINIGDNVNNSNSQISSLICNHTILQEHKKAHRSSSRRFSDLVWSYSSSPDRKCYQNEDSVANSILHTDGPLLENKDTQPLNVSSSLPRINSCEVKTKMLNQVTISPEKVVSPSLSLSPLGRKLSVKLKNAGGCDDSTNELNYNDLTSKDMTHSFDGPILGNLSFQRRQDGRMASKSLQVVDFLQQKFDQVTPENMIAMGEIWGQDSLPSTKGAKISRTLSGLSVRRSLVGSFEESLLSGSLASGLMNQVSVPISLSW